MRDRHPHLDRIFPRDPADGRTLIALRVDSYDALFDPLDPAPHGLRRVSQDVDDFLEGAFELIATDEPVRIVVTLPAEALDPAQEPGTTAALRAGVELRRFALARDLRRSHRRIFGLLLAGALPLIIGHLVPLLLGHHRSDGPIFGDFEWLVDNVLTIAAWVLVWEAVSVFAFERRDLVSRDRRLERLEDAPVVYRAVDRR